MMYGHQVIDDLLKICNRYAGQKIDHVLWSYLTNVKTIAHLVCQSQHFYLGNANEIYNLFGTHYTGKRLFNGETAQNIKLPYNKCFFEFDRTDDGKESRPDQIHTPKTGIVVWKQSDELWICYIINYLKEYQLWMPSDFYFWISLDKPLKEHDKFLDLLKINKIDPKKVSETSIAPTPMAETDKYWVDPQFIINEESPDLAILNIGLMLLSCKNIATQKNPAPEALNKARRKKGRTELFTYHTLKLIPFGKNKAYVSSGKEAESHYRIHLCRGHFKRFTEDRPLFGKLTGLYWWQPQVRGQDKSGVVMKDYELSVN